MGFEDIAITSAKWLWDKYGKDLIDHLNAELKQKWNKVKWNEAEANYRARMLEQHSYTRLLGYPKPISILDVFSGVFVLDKLTAQRRYDISQLQRRSLDRDSVKLESTKRNAIERVISGEKLYILGKPGSGKTTFLKYITIQACIGNIEKTPIYVSLQDLSNSGQDLLSFIEHQFDDCGIPDPKPFVKELFGANRAIILLDALDEMRQDKQKMVIHEIKGLLKKYPHMQICLTCRIAAVSYSLEGFTDVEMADFSEIQAQNFIYRWYDDDENRYRRMIAELSNHQNAGLRELTQTPLLLALLCLVFDDLGHFPRRRVDLYKEATDVLLKRWDETRGIERDSVYRRLSIADKRQLLMYLAYKYFDTGVYFIHEDDIGKDIAVFIQKLAPENKKRPDGVSILQSIEAQHGFLVQRGLGIYSFLHLTFQEYFTALYISENIADKNVSTLLKKRINDRRWDEVFSSINSLLSTK